MAPKPAAVVSLPLQKGTSAPRNRSPLSEEDLARAAGVRAQVPQPGRSLGWRTAWAGPAV
jgi:hypothetical protein